MYSLSDFDYELPQSLIAQHPAARRDDSRLLVLDRVTGNVGHRTIAQLPELLVPGDVVVVNRSRVIPARLSAIRDNGREAEVLLVKDEGSNVWEAMVHPGGKLKTGRKVYFPEVGTAEIIDVIGGGLRRLRFDCDVAEVMERYGTTPLPPYIERSPESEDRERYQTIFASENGSVAAPTAGLHFTEDLVKRISDRGAELTEILLHVGPGTFKPVSSDDISRHQMHAEYYEMNAETARSIRAARSAGHRIWAVGSTSARVLEASIGPNRDVRPGSGWTDMFIYPPYEFRTVDCLLTNFHLPRSTLLMLVAAFAGLEHTMAAYRAAIREGYRFYSYGDAMAVI